MSTKGGVSIPLFTCIFRGGEAIESFTKGFDEELYRALPNLYAVCISDNSQALRTLVGGLFVKTSYTHHDAEFLDAISALAKSSDELRDLVGPGTSFLPARIGVPDGAPLSEREMLQIMTTQFVKHSVGGNA